jgi:plastocyanin
MRVARLLAATTLVLAPACSGGGTSGRGAPSAAPAVTVVLQGFAFHPVTATVKRGDTVAWQFADAGIVHNVIGDDGLHSPDQGTGTYSHRFTRSGTFNYQCSLHVGMNGTVVVN